MSVENSQRSIRDLSEIHQRSFRDPSRPVRDPLETCQKSIRDLSEIFQRFIRDLAETVRDLSGTRESSRNQGIRSRRTEYPGPEEEMSSPAPQASTTSLTPRLGSSDPGPRLLTESHCGGHLCSAENQQPAATWILMISKDSHHPPPPLPFLLQD